MEHALTEMRRLIEELVAKRDERRDRFAALIARAMGTDCGTDADEVQRQLINAQFSRHLARRAVEIAQARGRLTIWSVVDALTRLSQESPIAGRRVECDQKAAALLALAA